MLSFVGTSFRTPRYGRSEGYPSSNQIPIDIHSFATSLPEYRLIMKFISQGVLRSVKHITTVESAPRL